MTLFHGFIILGMVAFFGGLYQLAGLKKPLVPLLATILGAIMIVFGVLGGL